MYINESLPAPLEMPGKSQGSHELLRLVSVYSDTDCIVKRSCKNVRCLMTRYTYCTLTHADSANSFLVYSFHVI